MARVLRFGYEPLRGFIETIGAMVLLFRRTIVAALTPPYNYGPELVDQFLFALRLGWFPMILASLAFTYGPAGIEVGNFLNLLGALDRLGGLFVIIVMREFAPLVCAIVMAGVAGTAMTADLGARKIREELDALMVLGVDPIKSLVVPRFLSLMLLTPLFIDLRAAVRDARRGAGHASPTGRRSGPFFSTFFAQATTAEFVAMLVKSIAVRRDDRDRLLLQGPDRLGRRRGGGARGQPGGRDRVPRASARSTTRSPRRCWPPIRR